MKLFTTLLTALFISSLSLAANVSITQLPQGTAATTSSLDVFPFVSVGTNVTKKMTIWDLVNVPTISATYAPLVSPTFTGTVTATSFVGPLTGNASTATALAANPTDCSANQYANAIAANGNLTCAQASFSQISGSVAAAQLPNPSSSTLGGVQSISVVANNFLTGISTSGVPTQAQPSFTNISGSVASTQMPALSGDVSTSAGATVTTIGAAKVTNTMLAGSITASKLVGTDITTVGTIGTGSWAASLIGLTYGGTNANLTAVAGGSVYSTGSAMGITAAGTAGMLLKSNGASAPTFAYPSYQTQSANYSVANGDYSIYVSASGASRTITLPTAVGISGAIFTIGRSDQTLANSVDIATTSSQTFSPSGTTSLHLKTQGEFIKVQSDGANWVLLERYINGASFTYTPANTQGFGTPGGTNSFVWWRLGSKIHIQSIFTTGTVSANQAQIALPTGLTFDSTYVPAHILCGYSALPAVGVAAPTVFATGGNSYMTFGFQNAGTIGQTDQNANAFLSNTQVFTFWCEAPITGWEG